MATLNKTLNLQQAHRLRLGKSEVRSWAPHLEVHGVVLSGLRSMTTIGNRVTSMVTIIIFWGCMYDNYIYNLYLGHL